MHTRFLSALATLLLGQVAWAADQSAAAPAPAAPVAETPTPVPDTAEASPAAPETATTTAGPTPTVEPAPPAATPDAALRGPVLLQAEGFEDPALVEELRAALSAEFGCIVILKPEDSRFAPTGRVVVARQADMQELAITFVDAEGQSSTRVVQEPTEPSERTRTVALLAGTLARSPIEGGRADAAVTPVPVPTLETSEPPPPVQPAVAALFYPLASNFDVPDVHTYFAFSLLYGRIGSLDGLGLGTLQFASRNVQGAQLAFLGNAAGGTVAGVQAALGVNSAGALSGLQLGIVNHSAGAVSGAQGSFLNFAGGDLTGMQAGLTVNIARDVQGGQVGLLNVAKNVRGVQIGLINVADEVDGVPIGLISVTKDGGVHPITWFSTVTYFNAGVKFATKYTYTFLNASWDPESSMVGPGGGIGGSVPIFVDGLFVDIDASETYLFKDSGPADEGRSLSRLRAAVRYQILPHLSVFAGGGYTGKIERAEPQGGVQGDYYYQSLGEFVAGIGL